VNENGDENGGRLGCSLLVIRSRRRSRQPIPMSPSEARCARGIIGPALVNLAFVARIRHSGGMKPTVYIETSVFSFYYDERDSVAVVAMRFSDYSRLY
jgi:hypothetical protein